MPKAVSGGGANYAKEYVDSASTMFVSATKDLVTGWYILLSSGLIALVVAYIWLAILKQSAGKFLTLICEVSS